MRSLALVSENFQLMGYPEVFTHLCVSQGKAVFYQHLESDSSSKLLESSRKTLLPFEIVFVLHV